MKTTIHRFVIPAESFPRWKQLGWRVARQQPDVISGLLIENDARWALWPCSCGTGISELRFTAFRGLCSDCWSDADEVEILH